MVAARGVSNDVPASRHNLYCLALPNVPNSLHLRSNYSSIITKDFSLPGVMAAFLQLSVEHIMTMRQLL